MKQSFDKGFVTPLPVFIIAVYDENGNANAMNAAWVGQVGGNLRGIIHFPGAVHLGEEAARLCNLESVGAARGNPDHAHFRIPFEDRRIRLPVHAEELRGIDEKNVRLDR